ncbi:hypothetical protein C8N26_0437 [Tenacibaculum lutimaris]|uniref:PKD domain-containing protein n=1 Tax=Tenacibaculum lutimaris TaxID=285258 RepID=A0A420E4N2_9FLAO|nr:hypothetical protein [Tenacibaculum lutimaris]RKF05038.1 hypothetical protein C8N26_0437 [Tenacibaculum lutimaris]
MKTNFKNFAFIVLSSIFLFSCQTEDSIDDMSPKIKTEKSKDESNLVSRSGVCSYIEVDNESKDYIGQYRTYTVVENHSTYQWSIENGNSVQIVGASNQKSVTLYFSTGFSQAEIRVVFGDCDERFTLTDTRCNVDCVNYPTRPLAYPVYSTFGSPVPNNYEKDRLGSNYICTTTINNELSVPFERCASYNWSITPAGNLGKVFPSHNSAIVAVTQPGTYTVTLTTTNVVGSRVEKFILYAEDCNAVGDPIGF